MVKRGATPRMVMVLIALLFVIHGQSTAYAGDSSGQASTAQLRRTDVRPTAQDLSKYRERIKALTVNSKRDADRIEFLLALIDYAKASVDTSSSRLTRGYYLSRLQDVVIRQRLARTNEKNRGANPLVPDRSLQESRRPGPNADPACYHEGQESECATDEEIAETQALADSVAYQNEENQLAFDEAIMLMYALDPSPDAAEMVSGPSSETEACINCWGQAATATATMGASVAAVLGWEGAKADALAASTKLSKATRWSWHITIVTTSLTAGYYLGSLIDCARNGQEPAPQR